MGSSWTCRLSPGVTGRCFEKQNGGHDCIETSGGWSGRGEESAASPERNIKHARSTSRPDSLARTGTHLKIKVFCREGWLETYMFRWPQETWHLLFRWLFRWPLDTCMFRWPPSRQKNFDLPFCGVWRVPAKFEKGSRADTVHQNQFARGVRRCNR